MKILKKVATAILGATIGFTSHSASSQDENSTQMLYDTQKIQEIKSQTYLNQQEIQTIENNEIIHSNIYLEIRQKGEYWFGDQRDEKLLTILNKFSNNSNKYDNIFTIEDIRLLLLFKQSYDYFIRQDNNGFTYENVSEKYKNINWIAVNIKDRLEKNSLKILGIEQDNSNNNTDENIPNMNEQSNLMENELNYLVQQYHNTNRFEDISYGNKNVFNYINDNEQYLKLLDVKKMLERQKDLSQRQKDYLYILNKLLPYYAYENRRKSIEQYLNENHTIEQNSILRNVRNVNASLSQYLEHTLINFSQINSNLSDLNLRYSMEKNISLRVLNTIALIENNFGNNKTSSSDAYGPFQVKESIIRKYNNGQNFLHIKNEDRFWISYMSGIEHISYLIQRYNLNLNFNINIPTLTNNNYNNLNQEEKNKIIDFLTLLSMYYDGEGSRFLNSIGNLTTYGSDGGSLAYIEKGVKSLYFFYSTETQINIPVMASNPNNSNEKIF